MGCEREPILSTMSISTSHCEITGEFNLIRLAAGKTTYRAVFTTSQRVVEFMVNLSKTQNSNKRYTFMWESLESMRWPNPPSSERRSFKSVSVC